jgi:hypothetical protein
MGVVMNPMRVAGHILLWCGFLVGAYVTVQHAENTADKWSTIAWPYYGLALSVGIAGVVILRATQRRAATHTDKLDADIKTLEVSVTNLLRQLGQLTTKPSQTDVFEVHKIIDSKLMDDLSGFVESRKTLIHIYGMREYAELMTDFSIAERNINRAWSASADGYVDEVWLSLERAEARLTAVAGHLAEYKKNQLPIDG